MLRWLRALLAAAFWGFILVGLLGVAEGVSQWLRFNVLAGDPAGVGPVRLLGPYLVLYGWFGLGAGLLLFLPACVLAHWSARPRRTAITLALSGAVASLLVLYAAYLGRVHLLPDWWEANGRIWGKIVLGGFWLVVVLILLRPVRALTEWLARQKTRTLIFPLLILIVATSLWPDWRAEGKRTRTGRLEPVAVRAADRPGAKNLILISIDTWRRDHLSRADPNSPPTPNLDDLSREGILLTNLWSCSPWTLPSMGTLMTGLPPAVLGVRKYVPLPPRVETLAEHAWRNGYRTVAFATNPYLTDWYGFDQGFEFFEHAIVLETLLPAERSVLAREATRYANLHFQVNSAEFVIPKAIAWLWQRGRGTPFFLWVHLMNPHLPYCWRDVPPPPEGENAVRGRQPDPGLVPAGGYFTGRRFGSVHLVRDGIFVPDEAQKEALRTLYAREVQYADHWLGRLFGALKRLDLWDDSVICVVSDHGEEFWEHDGFEHGHSLMPEVTGVPLILRYPGGPSGLIHRGAVGALDLFPTLCDLAGLPLPAGLPGESLRSRLPDEGSEVAGQVHIMENLLYGPQQLGVLAWPYFRLTPAEGKDLWFDLAQDPGALEPIPAPDSAAQLGAAADSLRTRWLRQAEEIRPEPLPGESQVPASVKRNLKSLGY